MSHLNHFLRNGLRNIKFNKIKNEILKITRQNEIINLKTNNGETQNSERLSINIVKNALNNLNYSFEEAGSQQSKDFRNICNIGLDIETKKTDNFTVYCNDTLPSSDIYYIIFFTGKNYVKKQNIPPKIIFINGFDLIKNDIYLLLDYKKEIEDMKDLWCRKKTGKNATKFKEFSVYVRPTYKINIEKLVHNDNYSFNIMI